MSERSASSIAFALVLTVCLFGLAKPPVSAAPLQWHDLGNYREAKVNRPVGQAPGFLLLSAKAAGVGFTNRLARARMVNANLLNGAGVAAGDQGYLPSPITHLPRPFANCAPGAPASGSAPTAGCNPTDSGV